MTTTTITPKTQTLTGFMADRRNWIGHADVAVKYDGPVPREDAMKLLDVPLVEGTVTVSFPKITEDGVETVSFDAPDDKAIMRADTGKVFRFAKRGYRIHPYPEWLIETTDTIVHGGLEIGLVALTKEGALALVQVEFPEGRVAVAPGAEPVAHRPRMTIYTSADGTVATNFVRSTRVLACENEVTVMGLQHFRGTHNFKVKHTTNSLMRIGQVREDLGIVVEEIGDAFDEEFRALMAQHVSDAKFEQVIQAFTGEAKAKEGRSKTIATNKANTLRDLWKNDERVAPWAGSAYGVLAAFNTAQHHEFGADKNRLGRNQEALIKGKFEKFDGNVLRLLATV